MNMPQLVAGVELGGTKSIAVLARGRDLIAKARWPTLGPEETLRCIADWIAAHEPVAAVGLASFGPLCLDPDRPDFGSIARTPKPLWSGTSVRGYFASRFAVPIGFDTDVAGAALAEGRWGASMGCDVHLYVTIGTGVGAGLVVGGRVVHGRIHPEVGHVRVRRTAGDAFAGNCIFHGDCLEGLIAGPAIAARAGKSADLLGSDDPVWTHVVNELAELMTLLILTVSPHRVVIGGGVLRDRLPLLPLVRARTAQLLGGYVAFAGADDLDEVIVPPGLGLDAGPLGAIALAEEQLGILAQSGGDDRKTMRRAGTS